MTQSSDFETSPLRSVYAHLRTIHPNWYVVEGVPDEAGWIAGRELTEPERGPLGTLLENIGARLKTQDRKVVAASFALRFGWSSGPAIGPFVVSDCVPDMSLENLAIKFSQTLFERVALRTGRATVLRDSQHASLPLAAAVDDRDALILTLRRTLIEQASPVVLALSAWSRLNKPAIWGQVLSSWGAQIAAVFAELGRHEEALATIDRFFCADEPAFSLKPRFYPIHHAGVTRVYHRRGSCCLYYRTPAESYCASCPLVEDEERYRRNRAWIEKSLETP